MRLTPLLWIRFTIASRRAFWHTTGISSRLLAKARARDAEHAEDLLVSVCAAFWRLKSGNDKFWSGQPFLPSTLNASGIWDRVLESMRRDEMPEEVRAIIAGEIA
jgi:hypothetical protein